MTADQARDEMLAVFKAAWDTTAYAANVVYEDKAAGPSDAGWARVTLRHADAYQSSLADSTGKKRWTNIGTLWIQIFTPVGNGLTTAYSLANTVINAFRDASGGTVWYRKPRLREVGSNGAFEQINVLTDFTYDETR